ncbi:hypothetical protein BT69DRAFT_68179 [Atractiella rhizophila]|nr:hypothetical protein BT69DRAFT_68179 [Atractiella rhizophila]
MSSSPPSPTLSSSSTVSGNLSDLELSSLSDGEIEDFEIISNDGSASVASVEDGASSSSDHEAEANETASRSWATLNLLSNEDRTPAATTPQGSVLRESPSMSLRFPDPMKDSDFLIKKPKVDEEGQKTPESLSLENSVMLDEDNEVFGSTIAHFRERTELDKQKVVERNEGIEVARCLHQEGETKPTLGSQMEVEETPTVETSGGVQVKEEGNNSPFDDPAEAEVKSEDAYHTEVEFADTKEEPVEELPPMKDEEELSDAETEPLITKPSPAIFRPLPPSTQSPLAFFKGFADKYLHITLGGPTLVIIIAILAATTATWSMLPGATPTANVKTHKLEKYAVKGSISTITAVPSVSSLLSLPTAVHVPRLDSTLRHASAVSSSAVPVASSSPRIDPSPAYYTIGCGTKCHPPLIKADKKHRRSSGEGKGKERAVLDQVERFDIPAQVSKLLHSHPLIKADKERRSAKSNGKGKERAVQDEVEGFDVSAQVSKLLHSPVLSGSELVDIIKTFFMQAWDELMKDERTANIFDPTELKKRRTELEAFLKTAAKYLRAMEKKGGRGAKRLLASLKEKRDAYINGDGDRFGGMKWRHEMRKDMETFSSDMLKRAKRGAGKLAAMHQHHLRSSQVGRKTCMSKSKRAKSKKAEGMEEDPVMNVWQDFGIFV